MERRKPGMDKTVRPEYLPETIWEAYQECQNEAEKHAAFGRVIFGDGGKNSQRAMERTWRTIEAARHAVWVDMVEREGDWPDVNEGHHQVFKYKNLARNIRALESMRTRDFSKMENPGERKEKIEEIMRVGKRFLKLLENAYGVDDYAELTLGGEGREALEGRVMEECNRPGSNIDWAIQKTKMDVSSRDFGREQEGKGSGYLFSDQSSEMTERRSAMLEDYEHELRERVIPLVIGCTVDNFRKPLADHLRDVLEDLESDAYWVMREGHILPRVNIKNPKRTYMVRYLAGAFCTLFCVPPDKQLALDMLGEAGIIATVGRIVGAVLEEEIEGKELKDILKGFHPDGISIKKRSFTGEEDSEE